MNFKINLDLEYEILFGSDYLADMRVLDKLNLSTYSQHVLIIDSNLDHHKLDKLTNYLCETSQLTIIKFVATEENKTYSYCEQIMHELFSHDVTRNSLIWAIGGGVLGDTVGFVASIYKRGIDYVQIPTTLLSQVDSSIGGKVAINNQFGKNLVGALYTPNLVIIDYMWLDSLPLLEYNNGIFEIVKILLLVDKSNYNSFMTDYINDLRNASSYIPIAIQHKLDIVSQDFTDKIGLRNLLNFGHTFAHALETVSNYQIKHGYAVGYGIVFESYLSYHFGLLPHTEYIAIKLGMSKFGLDYAVFNKYTIQDLANAMLNDKKNDKGMISFILLQNIGKYATSNNKNKHEISRLDLIEIYNIFWESLAND